MEKQAIITFQVGTTISGKSIAEIKRKFEAMNIPAELEYIELCYVEDAETRDDLMEVWDNDQNLCELEDELREQFDDFDTDTLSIEDFGLKYNEALITHITMPNEADICFWSGNPHTDKYAEEIQITDYDQKREIIIEILQYL
jgi:hypothetical protein